MSHTKSGYVYVLLLLYEKSTYGGEKNTSMNFDYSGAGIEGQYDREDDVSCFKLRCITSNENDGVLPVDDEP